MQATSSNVVVGSRVWVEDPEVAWIDGEVVEVKGEEIKIKCSSGKEVNASPLKFIFNPSNKIESTVPYDFTIFHNEHIPFTAHVLFY